MIRFLIALGIIAFSVDGTAARVRSYPALRRPAQQVVTPARRTTDTVVRGVVTAPVFRPRTRVIWRSPPIKEIRPQWLPSRDFIRRQHFIQPSPMPRAVPAFFGGFGGAACFS